VTGPRLLVLALAVLALGAAGASAQTVTDNPVMTRGPATAPVTIVEFSDYQ
jgi:protein-disulfide isomerase